MTRGKKARALRVDRTAEREAQRRRERRQTIFTSIVVGLLVIIGGALIYVSANPPDVAESPSEGPSDLASDKASEQASENRPVACGRKKPATSSQPKQTFPKPDQVLNKGKDYGAVILTSCGPIRVDLFETEAPETVNSFVFLAQKGFFNGLEVFRNAKSIGALQTGAGTNEATWDIGYKIGDELSVAKEDGYPAGVLAMANSGPDTAGSQFFFVYNDKFDAAFKTPDKRTYAVFGKTDAAGVKVLQRIGNIPTSPPDPTSETPSQLVYIESIKITTK